MLTRRDAVPAWPLCQTKVVRAGNDSDVLVVVVRTRLREEADGGIRQNGVRLQLTGRYQEDRRAIDAARREAYECLALRLMWEPVGGP